MLVPVILSGGAGTRLWPISRQAHPKPFMELADGESLLEKTAKRALALDGVEVLMTITNRDHYFTTRDVYAELPGISADFDYVLEPMGRNTGPAIAMAARRLVERHGGDTVMLVLAADHLIAKQDAFAAAVADAIGMAKQGMLVTFGITPTHPETGFGYIERGDVIDGSVAGRRVARFVEKPDLATAESYLDSGEFLWNSGMFCFTAQAYLDALQAHAGDMAAQTEVCWEASQTQQVPLELDSGSFEKMPNISVDYAVMERAGNVAVVECDLGWSDIGSWSAVAELSASDANGNASLGEAILVGSRNCYVQSDNHRIVAGVGLENLVVVDTPDAVLIADKAHAQDVKKVVEVLKAESNDAYLLHRTAHRPWGTYTVLEEDQGFKMKRIVVKPGRELSLQMHHHRSEHWIVVSGTAKVVNGDDEFLVRTNESTYIPIGNKHRLSNPGVVDLVMIEVQVGEYLEEDDIVRFEDVYGRA